MTETVTECLKSGTDCVTLINSINTDASAEPAVKGMTQAEINTVVQRNVDHLSFMLLYETPDIAGAASNLKSTHVAAVTTGTDYIAAN